jgi:tetratricopeptide (TPR) repeat protein
MRTSSPVILLAALLCSLAGCRPVQPPDTTRDLYEPLFAASDVRSGLTAARRDAGASEGVRQALAAHAEELWVQLAALQQQHDLSGAEGREREASILRAYLAAVSRALAVLPEAEVEAQAPLRVTYDAVLAAADAHADAGRYVEAVATAEALLERIPSDDAHTALTAYTRYRLGLWQLALGEYELAQEALRSVQPAQQLAADMADRARLMGEQIDLLTTLTEGPERDRLAHGWVLLEMGDIAGAGAAGREVAEGSSDPEARREAGFLVSETELARASVVDELRRRAGQDLADGVPFDLARDCAVRIAEHGAETVASELNRAIEAAEALVHTGETAELDVSWARAVDEAQSLVAEERFRDAAALYARFEGSDREDQARQAAARTLDILVREERRRAGDLFVAAQQEADPARRTELLEAARALLAGLLAEFPDSGYADRIRRNLDAVEQAMGVPD